jgi:polyisoprenoid-binding protein YceI
MRTVVKRQGTVILCLTMAACGAPPPKPSAAPREPAAAAPAASPRTGMPPAASMPAARPPPATPPEAAPAVGARYGIDPDQSELRVLVYRAGPMASLGHNHVIFSRGLQGWATFDGNASGAAFAVTAPVAAFVIDDPKRRMEEGADFAEDVTDEARSGTAHNMLGVAVLNAADFPTLTIRSVSVAATAGSYEARVALEIAGHASTLVVPFMLETSPRRLIAHGEFALRQSAIGLTPFSVFLGALKVQDELRVKFKFVAVRGGT